MHRNSKNVTDKVTGNKGQQPGLKHTASGGHALQTVKLSAFTHSLTPGVKWAPHSPYQCVFGPGLTRAISYSVALKMPCPSSLLKSPLLPLCFTSLFCIHHVFNSQPGLLPAQCDLTWCDGSSQPGRGPGVVLTHPTPWLVPDSGSLLEGHRDLWDTQWHHSL